MGQKVHPYGFRLGYTKTWRSRWFAKQGYADLVAEDLKLKKQLRSRLRAAGISSIELDRPGNKLRITIRTARPGIIIGRRGTEIEKLKEDLQTKTKRDVYIDIQEVHRPELDAQLVAESVALQVEKRVAFRRAMRKAVDSAGRFGCKGIKIRVAGRLNGKEIARSESHLQGRMPQQTLRADIDYGFAEAFTTYGVIGVKCWVYKGDIIDVRSTTAPGGGREELEPARRREARSAAQRERERSRRGGRDEAPPATAPAAPQAAPAPAVAPAPQPAAEGAPFRPPLAAKPAEPAADQASAAEPTAAEPAAAEPAAPAPAAAEPAAPAPAAAEPAAPAPAAAKPAAAEPAGGETPETPKE